MRTTDSTGRDSVLLLFCKTKGSPLFLLGARRGNWLGRRLTGRWRLLFHFLCRDSAEESEKEKLLFFLSAVCVAVPQSSAGLLGPCISTRFHTLT